MGYLGRLASIIGAAALFAGCGGSASSPIAAPGLVPGSATTQARVHQASGTSGDLVYVDTKREAYILTYPGLSLVTSFDGAGGSITAADPNNGNVLLGNAEFAHGATTPFARLSLPSGEYIYSAAFDPTTDNMAFTIQKTFYGSRVGVYADLYSTPANYYDSQMKSLGELAYDGNGNLFVEAFDTSGHLFIAELPKGSSTFTNYSMDQTLHFPGVMRWDGQYLVIRSQSTISRLAISGSSMRIISKTKLTGLLGAYNLGYWLLDGFAIGPHGAKGTYLGLWKYPNGGKASKVVKTLGTKDVYGVAVSAGTSR